MNRVMSAPRPASPRPRGPRPQCEQLEARLQPALFLFSTGLPDGKMATISEPPSAHNAQVDFETADDFVLNTETVISHASFTGLLTGGATPKDVSNVVVEIYRVFPNDSVNPPDGKVPSRKNSPADNEIDSFDSALGDLHFHSRLLRTSFTAENSVSSQAAIVANTGSTPGGSGPATGEEVQFNVAFDAKLDLPAGHYFFVPRVGLTDTAPAGADFLWLSAPKPIKAPGTPFPAGTTDLQSWMRSTPGIGPDWMRIGQDIVGGHPFPTFNASFTLYGETVPPHIAKLSRSSADEGSPNLTITISGSNFTRLSAVLLDGIQPLATTFLSPNKLRVTIPADFLAEEGQFQLSVSDGQGAFSNAKTFRVTEIVPDIDASAVNGLTFQQVTVSGQVLDAAPEDHAVRINWGDGHVQVVSASADGTFAVNHTFDQPGHVHHDTIVVRALDDEGVAGSPLELDVIV
jgi:hypothetical protein